MGRWSAREHLGDEEGKRVTTVFLIVVGVGLLAVAYRAHHVGEIRAGRAGFKPYRPTRAESPGAFYFYLTLYIGAGLALLVWGVLVIAGVARPLPLK
jgi:hypothetical protein